MTMAKACLLVAAMLPGPLVLEYSAAVYAAPAAAAGDAERGKVLFEKRCTGCHSLDQDKEGPRLRHVYGSKAGSVSSFKYSSALSAAHVTWDQQSLDKWLTDPESIAPDNDMAFRLPKPEERADIIRYLQLASGR